MRPASCFLHCLHQMARPARPIAALAGPQAEELDLVGPEAESLIQYPAVVAFVRVVAFGPGPELARRNMQDAARLDGKEPRAPVAIREIDRLLQWKEADNGTREWFVEAVCFDLNEGDDRKRPR
jgi:hypothetical protein